MSNPIFIKPYDPLDLFPEARVEEEVTSPFDYLLADPLHQEEVLEQGQLAVDQYAQAYFQETNSQATSNEYPPQADETLASSDSEFNSRAFNWAVTSGNNLNTVISGRLFCALEKVELDQTTQKYRLYQKNYKYTLLLPKAVLTNEKVSFGVTSGETKESVCEITPDTSSSTAWDLFEFKLKNLQFRSGRNSQPAQLTLTQGDQELHSQRVLIFYINRSVKRRPVHLDPEVTITTSNSTPFAFQCQNEQISAHIFSKKSIEINPAMNCLQFYERFHSYSLLIPKNVFNGESSVDIELELEGKRAKFLTLFPDDSSDDDWTIYSFSFLGTAKIHPKRRAARMTMILSQGEKALVSMPFALRAERRNPLSSNSETDEFSSLEVPAKFFHELETTSQTNAIPVDEKSCALGWKMADNGVYSQLRCDSHKMTMEKFLQVPILDKKRYYTIKIPHENNPFDLSQSVNFEVLFSNIKTPLLTTEAHSEESWDLYPIRLTNFPDSSGPTKQRARLILSQNGQELSSDEVIILERIREDKQSSKRARKNEN